MKVWAKDVDGDDGRRRTTHKKKITVDQAVEEYSKKIVTVPDNGPVNTCQLHSDSDFVQNVGKGMYGYNVYHSSPFSSAYAGTDPGYRHRRLWEVSYSDCQTSEMVNFQAVTGNPLLYGPEDVYLKYVPDGWTVKQGSKTACEANFDEPTVSASSFEYKDTVIQKSSFTIDLVVIPVSASHSSESKQFVETNGEEKRALVQTQVECVSYILELDKRNPPRTSATFKFVVDQIDEDSPAEQWYKFFDTYGTHYPTKVKFGARYGYSSWLDESSFKDSLKEEEEESVSATVKKDINKFGKTGKEWTKGPAKLGLTLSATAGYTEKGSSKQEQEFVSKFRDIKEFSLGKRMPRGNDRLNITGWAQEAGGEPMPVRADYTSICEHPAIFQGDRTDPKFTTCIKYIKNANYCKKYINAKNPGACADKAKPQCIWDLECPKYNLCVHNKCEELPSCKVWIYKDTYQNGKSWTVGPFYYREHPTGKVYELKKSWDDISSIKYSSGCDELELYDQDDCKVGHSENKLIENRRQDKTGKVNSFADDLDNDICKIKAKAKKEWYTRRRGY